jgi:hypothetical protein
MMYMFDDVISVACEGLYVFASLGRGQFGMLLQNESSRLIFCMFGVRSKILRHFHPSSFAS